MPFTIEEFRDLVRMLEEKPEWRADLRRLVLTDELLSLPEQVAELRVYSERRFQELAEAQARTEAKVAELADAQARTEAKMAELAEAQVRTEVGLIALTEAQARTEAQLSTLSTQVAGLTQSVHTLTDWVGDLKGITTEIEYRTKARAYFGRLLRRPHVLSPEELTSLLDDAVEAGVLPEDYADDIALADIVLRGKHKHDGTDVYLLVEVSWGVGPTDIERAARRAARLAQLGTPVIPAVAGRRLTAEVAELARTKQVWQIMDGYTLAPEPPI
ncbi:MAG: hypothetical protein HY268_09865 [Deltaproteobacteria bacterium]|nr:hypothetical protein [Deltaproteobacteria bacterium]